jgi:ABC-2 type transport system permease protein
MKSLGHAIRTFPTLLRVGFADAVAYRAEFIVWVLAYTMPIIMLGLWTAVAREGPLGRFGEREFQAYFLATLVVRLSTGSWVVWDINTEVRQGTLQKRLLRPIHPLLTYLAENMAALPMRFVVILPIACGTILWLGRGVLTHDPLQLAIVPLSLLGAFLLTFWAMASIGTLSMFLESSIAVFDLWLGFYTVLSGYVMPLALFPERVQAVLVWLPFRQMLAFPVENMLGLLSREQSLSGLLLQWAYVGLFAFIARQLWRAGMKRFAAFGG